MFWNYLISSWHRSVLANTPLSTPGRKTSIKPSSNFSGICLSIVWAESVSLLAGVPAAPWECKALCAAQLHHQLTKAGSAVVCRPLSSTSDENKMPCLLTFVYFYTINIVKCIGELLSSLHYEWFSSPASTVKPEIMGRSALCHICLVAMHGLILVALRPRESSANHLKGM